LNIFSSDSNFTDDKNENNQYDEGSKPLPSENKILKPIKENQANDTTAKSSELLEGRQEFVTEKVEEVSNIEYDNIKDTISKTNLSENAIGNGRDNAIDHHHTTPRDPAQEMVRDWEVTHTRIRLTPKIRELALLAASIHILEYRGIIVNDLKKLGISNDNAEKKLQDALRLGLLVPHQSIRIGKQKQYFLSNYMHIADERNNERDNDAEILPNDVSLLLARELSDMEYVYHNIHLETALSYKEDYDLLKWHIPSSSNRQKVKKFKLEARRNCSIVISSTGTVNISIECTLQPYEFHTPSGLVTFFASCGQIWKLLQLETDDRLTVVPPIDEWYLQRFDYNKDISIQELESKHAATTTILTYINS
jgi:hypothetical protein